MDLRISGGHLSSSLLLPGSGCDPEPSPSPPSSSTLPPPFSLANACSAASQDLRSSNAVSNTPFTHCKSPSFSPFSFSSSTKALTTTPIRSSLLSNPLTSISTGPRAFALGTSLSYPCSKKYTVELILLNSISTINSGRFANFFVKLRKSWRTSSSHS